MQVMISVAELDGVEVLHTEAGTMPELAAYLSSRDGRQGLLATLQVMAERPKMAYCQWPVVVACAADALALRAPVTSNSGVFEEVFNITIKEVQPLHL